MARVRALVASALAVVALAGCSGADDEEEAAAPAPPAPTTTRARPAEPARVAAGTRGRTYTVEEVEKRLSAVTKLPVVRFAAASTPDVTSLRTRPHETGRFGEFQLFVFRPAAARRMRRTFTAGGAPDARGIYWVPDQAGGWIAVTVHGRNLVLGWFPPAYGSKAVDERWERLQAAVAKIL